ncbi:hypothetical protein PybrP1_003356 [[Pythium] brassicae (nom. inval.)]|nr:hypothetical protein PybrP1_003356 [[Pythium] brassicae (nom. inval.)]
MVVKALLGTAKDLWQRRLLPAQLRAKDTRLGFAEILGDESLRGAMLPAGPVLALMDLLAGVISLRTAKGVVATVSFDRVELLKPVFHGDFVRVEGQVIAIGSSSMAIQVDGFRYDTPNGAFERTHSALVTMVAIDRFMRPRKGLPELVDEPPERCRQMRETARQRAELTRRWREEQGAVDRLPIVSKDMLLQRLQSKDAFVAVSDTQIEMRNWLLPRHMNQNNTMFGGDLLSWMDQTALQCAKAFAKNDRMVTIDMNRVAFKLPIHSMDVVTLKARVTNVRHVRLEVEVEVFVESVYDASSRMSHVGYFTVLNTDAASQPKPIETGLLIDETNQADMRTLLKAQKRWQFEKENQDLSVLQPLGISIPGASRL